MVSVRTIPIIHVRMQVKLGNHRRRLEERSRQRTIQPNGEQCPTGATVERTQ